MSKNFYNNNETDIQKVSIKTFGEFDVFSKSIEMANLEQSIRDSIYTILSTIPGERIMEPSYGIDLGELIFRKIDSTLKTKVSNDIKAVLSKFELRINVSSVEIVDNDELVNINISYSIIETREKKNYKFAVEK